MSISSIADFESALKESMKMLFGECKEYKGMLRCLPEHLGVSDSGAIIEAAFETGLNPDAPYPLLHFRTTLAQNIEEAKIPGVLMGLNDLNSVINAGAFPAFGCFCFYAPLKQIFTGYRMALNPDALEEDFENARYYLASLYETMDLFIDYIQFLCADPDRMTLKDYMAYLDYVSDMNDLKFRMEQMEKLISMIDGAGKRRCRPPDRQLCRR